MNKEKIHHGFSLAIPAETAASSVLVNKLLQQNYKSMPVAIPIQLCTEAAPKSSKCNR
jgi:hypothetical protein